MGVRPEIRRPADRTLQEPRRVVTNWAEMRGVTDLRWEVK